MQEVTKTPVKFWIVVGVILLAFAGGIFSLLAFVWAVEIPKAIFGALLVTFIFWALLKRETDAEPLSMNESVWLDVDTDKEDA